MKILKNGAYLVGGKLIAARADVKPRLKSLLPLTDEAIENAYRGTIAYSLLQAHNLSASEKTLQLRFDAIASHDITYVGIIQTAKASGLTEFPLSYTLTNCHNSLCS